MIIAYTPTGQCTTQCWNGAHKYLYNGPGQTAKFCLCAEGRYGSLGYTPSPLKRTTAYRYTDAGNNSIWNVFSSSAKSPLTAVRCPSGSIYSTNVDRFR